MKQRSKRKVLHLLSFELAAYLEDDATSSGATDSDIKENLGVRHVVRCLCKEDKMTNIQTKNFVAVTRCSLNKDLQENSRKCAVRREPRLSASHDRSSKV